MSQVVEVFGKYAVQIAGETKMFDTEAEASSAVVLAENEAEFQARAEAFCEGIGLKLTDDEGKANKAAVGKANVVKQFLAFEATLSEAE